MTTPISTLPNGQTIGTVTPTAAASTTAGNDLAFTASAATAGTTNAGAAAGGSFTFTAGNAARKTSGDGNGGGFTFTAGTPVGAGSYGVFSITNAAGTNNKESPAFRIGSFGWFIDPSGKLICSSSGQTVSSSTVNSSYGFATRSDGLVGFVNSTDVSTGTADVAIGRAAQNILEVNTATSGTLATIRFANLQGNNVVKALTEASATTFVTITVPSGSSASGKIQYSIEANDATDFQIRSGELYFSAVNKAGTITATLFRAQGSTTVDNTTDGVAVSTGTLTNTFTAVDGGSGALQIKANATSSLTQTTLQIRYRVEILNTNTITPA